MVPNLNLNLKKGHLVKPSVVQNNATLFTTFIMKLEGFEHGFLDKIKHLVNLNNSGSNLIRDIYIYTTAFVEPGVWKDIWYYAYTWPFSRAISYLEAHGEKATLHLLFSCVMVLLAVLLIAAKTNGLDMIVS